MIRIEAIEEYIRKDSELRGGYFLIYDWREERPVALSFHGIPRERVRPLGPNAYLACVDMFTPAGEDYNVDFFLRGADPEEMEVTNISIHAAAGCPRYEWREEGGVLRQYADEF